MFLERVDEQPYEDETEQVERRHSVAARVVDLLDSWLAVVADYSNVNAAVKYQKYEGKAGAGHLLREMLEGGLRVRASRQVPGQPVAERRGARGQPADPALDGFPIGR